MNAASPLPREALFKALAGIVEEGIDHRDAVDAVLAAGFRRSVVSTPLGTLDDPQGTLHDAADRVAAWIERLDGPAALALEADDLRRLVDHARVVSTPSEPVAYAIYGRVTGSLKYVEVLDEEEVAERAEFYDVVPLYRSTPPTITDEMAEGMARMLHARSSEGRSGFSWPSNGDWDRQRDLDAARRVLDYVFTFVSKCAGCHATVTTANPHPKHEDGCFVAARAALGGEA